MNMRWPDMSETAPDYWLPAQLKPSGLATAMAHCARQGFSPFMPVLRVTQRTRAGLRTQRKPLFAGYLFVGVDDPEAARNVLRSTRGISRVLTRPDGRAAVVPADLMAAMRAQTGKDGCFRPMDDLSPGEQVKIVRGPFSGLLANVLEVNDQQRVILLMDMMGRRVSLAADRGAVQRA